MAGVKEAKFYLQYKFSNGQRCDTVQKKNNATRYIHISRKSQAAFKCSSLKWNDYVSPICNFKFTSSTFEKKQETWEILMDYILPSIYKNCNFNP